MSNGWTRTLEWTRNWNEKRTGIDQSRIEPGWWSPTVACSLKLETRNCWRNQPMNEKTKSLLNCLERLSGIRLRLTECVRCDWQTNLCFAIDDISTLYNYHNSWLRNCNSSFSTTDYNKNLLQHKLGARTPVSSMTTMSHSSDELTRVDGGCHSISSYFVGQFGCRKRRKM